jgi:hypothetical protein
MHIEIPDKKGLQEFALVTGGLFVGLFGLLFPWLFGLAFPLWPWIISGVLCSLALLIPNSLKLIYQGWMMIALGLGWINTRILLAIVFYVIITPMGLVMWLLGKRPLKDKSSQSESYRNLKKPLLPEQMEHPF